MAEQDKRIEFVKSYLPDFLIGCLGIVLLFYRLGEIPGVHLDEAWILDHAGRLGSGKDPFPIDGMHSYTGTLHLYILWPLFELFGYHIVVLRSFSAVLNLLMVMIVLRLGRLFLPGDKREMQWVGLMLVTSPFFVLYSRFGTEVTSFLPLLCILGLYLISRAAMKKGRFFFVWAFIGGMCLGIAVYTHVLTAVVPISASLAVVFVLRWAAFRMWVLWCAVAGVVFGFVPRLFQMLFGSGTGEWERHYSTVISTETLSDILSLPLVLTGIWDGDLLYQRFVGENIIPVMPYYSIVFVACVLAWVVGCFRYSFKRPEFLRDLGFFVFFVLLNCLATLLTIRGMSMRYYFLLSLFVPFLMLLFVRSWLSQGSALAKRLIFAAGLIVVVTNCVYVTGNYFVAFSRSNGKSCVFEVGQRLKETSNHFMRTELLYEQLVDRGIKTVHAKDFIVRSLLYHDRDKAKLRLRIAFPIAPAARVGPDNTAAALVFYNGEMVWNFKIYDLRDREFLANRYIRFKRDKSFDPHFLVYLEHSRRKYRQRR